MSHVASLATTQLCQSSSKVATDSNMDTNEQGGAKKPICWCLVAKSCLTLCDTIDCSLLGSSVHGIFKARILEWVGHFLLQKTIYRC